MDKQSIHRGTIVTAAGTGINLALGVLYTWSIFKGAIKQSIQAGGPNAFHWDPASLNDPYAVCCIVFACMMIVAGRIQDTFGPRITALTGGVLVGMGFLWIATTTSYLSWVLGFGVLAGAGIAFGYSAATPAALKWYPPTKTGRISGLVVSGFGLASVYIAPLAQYLLGRSGIGGAMTFFGIAFFIVVGLLALFLRNPPAGYVAPGFEEQRGRTATGRAARDKIEDRNARPFEMMRESAFWLHWVLYFIGAGAGLMVIGSVAGMAKSSLGQNAFLAVAILAIGNAGGRIAAGMLSDTIGRKRTLLIVFSLQAMLMLAAIPITSAGATSAVLLLLLATLIGFNYGANLALFPSLSKDLWGMKNFGMNYGILFTAWGVGGLVMGRVSETLFARTGTYTISFLVAGACLLAGVVIILFMQDRKEEMRRKLGRKLVLHHIRV
jgi:OFA family oxalate/formate antiporter-like MFS transporter